jgi:hypothetical protein
MDTAPTAQSTIHVIATTVGVLHELGGTATIDICCCGRIEDIVARLAAVHSLVVVGGPVRRCTTPRRCSGTSRSHRALARPS